MTEFVSERVTVNASNTSVYNFLGDFTNFEELMPEQIRNWRADKDTCSFTIEGMADLSMRIASRSVDKNIHIVADGKNPIDFTLDCFLFPVEESICKVELIFAAPLNPFVKTLASRPLQNFVDMLAIKLQQHFS
jgi:carbon monoxide dehydrogenase subunit G